MEPIDITDEIPFDIPNNWNWIRICNCADIYTGNSISETVKNTKYKGIKEGYNYIGTKDVNFDNTINYDNGVKIPFNEPKFRNAYKDNTLICVEGGSAGRKVAKLSEDVCFGNKLATINSWIINPEYIYLVFQSSIIQNFFKNNMTGIIGGVSINKLKTFLIPIPPFREQKRIVSKYKLFISLINKYDNEYCKIEKLNANYKDELKKSILQYAIQGKLVKQDSNDESAEVLINKILGEKRELIKTKQIKKENLSVIYKDSTDNQFYEKFDDGKIVNITNEIPFDIPENWCWTRMGNIYSIIRGSSPRPKGSPIYWAKERTNYHWITIKDISTFKTDKYLIDTKDFLTIEGSKRSTYVEKNNIIIAVSGSTTGKSCILGIDGYIYDGLAALVSFCQDINSCYVYYYFQFLYDYLNSQKIGSAIPNINTDVLKHTFIPIPPLKEQYIITSKLEKLLSLI